MAEVQYLRALSSRRSVDTSCQVLWRTAHTLVFGRRYSCNYLWGSVVFQYGEYRLAVSSLKEYCSYLARRK
jgi:hypothetical protein